MASQVYCLVILCQGTRLEHHWPGLQRSLITNRLRMLWILRNLSSHLPRLNTQIETSAEVPYLNKCLCTHCHFSRQVEYGTAERLLSVTWFQPWDCNPVTVSSLKRWELSPSDAQVPSGPMGLWVSAGQCRVPEPTMDINNLRDLNP